MIARFIPQQAGAHLNKLRTLGITLLTLVVLLAAAGIISAIAELWVAAVSLLFGSVVLSVLTTLLNTRYVSWNARTGEQRTKIIVQQLSARVREAMNEQSKATADLRLLVESIRNAQIDARGGEQQLQSELKTGMRDLQASVAEVTKGIRGQTKSMQQHTTSMVRDSTRQVEALAHIYQQYPEVKLPMPSTGRWAIDSQALAHMIALIEERKPRRILELGSGTSTIWIGYLCKRYGGKLVTLDHLDEFLNLTRTAVDRHRLTAVVDSRLAPLEPLEHHGKAFNWYATESFKDLSDIDMLVIDGPPASTGPQARYPALPRVLEHLAPNVTVILDDAHREDEAKIVASWLTDYPDFQEIEQGTSRLAVLQRTAQ